MSKNMAAAELVGEYFSVLDNGFVSLVDYMGTDDDIAEAARVSYQKGTTKKRNNEGLIRYLMRNRHTSPIEQVELKFHIALPIFVMRQLVRHRTASLNEMSARYSEMPETFYVPEKWRIQGQSKDNKQQSSEEKVDWPPSGFQIPTETAFEYYHDALEVGVVRELARTVLPQNIYTQVYIKFDLHNLLHLLSLRFDSHAQWEIQEYARVMCGIVAKCFPVTFQAFLDYRLNAVSFSKGEMDILLDFLHSESFSEKSEVIGSAGDYLSKREEREFWEKLDYSKRPTMTTVDDFVEDLEHNTTLSPEEAERRFFGE